ncbi:hydrogenase maturation nickel metallochaperone HypA/HybF [Saccharomonospora saliphila]|uniref:hydrogenase maturation nickel metallochaperone HypA/HybF n=1 Tax=Saccharomonospora saliphila TaxID=369829 RepID=UPI0003756041|nr:hydrogenase maturation nickel metallochaperone HypA [Saccharomonospora saliphila]
MHELSITQGVVRAVVEHTGGDRVLVVRLEIGALSGVEVDSVRFCFDAVTRGTPLDGAELVVDRPEGRGRCRPCGAEFPLGSVLDGCACGSLDVEVVAGEQLRIRNVEVARDVRNMRV